MMDGDIIPFTARTALIASLFFVLASLSAKAWNYALCYLHFELGCSGFPRGPPSTEVMHGIKRADVHRDTIDLVNNKYGPVFWFRLFGFHVSPSSFVHPKPALPDIQLQGLVGTVCDLSWRC